MHTDKLCVLYGDYHAFKMISDRQISDHQCYCYGMVRMRGGGCNKSKLLGLATVDVPVYPSCHAKSCHITNWGLVREHQKTSRLKILVMETLVFYFHCSLVFTLSDSNHKFLILSTGCVVPQQV